MTEAPTEKQWKRIKARIAEIDGQYTPPQVIIERYRSEPWWREYRPYFSTNPVCTFSAGITGDSGLLKHEPENFSSDTAFKFIGMNEAKENI